MNRHYTYPILALGLVCASACSHAPQATLASAAANGNTIVAKPAPPAKAANTKPAKPVNAKYLRLGYQARVRRGQYIYCREQVPTGSWLRSEICKTEAELEQQDATTHAVLENVSQRNSRCNLAGCRRR